MVFMFGGSIRRVPGPSRPQLSSSHKKSRNIALEQIDTAINTLKQDNKQVENLNARKTNSLKIEELRDSIREIKEWDDGSIKLRLLKKEVRAVSANVIGALQDESQDMYYPLQHQQQLYDALDKLVFEEEAYVERGSTTTLTESRAQYLQKLNEGKKLQKDKVTLERKVNKRLTSSIVFVTGITASPTAGVPAIAFGIAAAATTAVLSTIFLALAIPFGIVALIFGIVALVSYINHNKEKANNQNALEQLNEQITTHETELQEIYTNAAESFDRLAEKKNSYELLSQLKEEAYITEQQHQTLTTLYEGAQYFDKDKRSLGEEEKILRKQAKEIHIGLSHMIDLFSAIEETEEDEETAKKKAEMLYNSVTAPLAKLVQIAESTNA